VPYRESSVPVFLILEQASKDTLATSHCHQAKTPRVHQRAEVEFSSHDLPVDVPPEISLCLFRVLQQALHNAVKHSGVKHFEAQLWGSQTEIHLSVSDLGIGFDVETALKSHGIGLTD
jgi:signal transduction histidine kinase